MTLAELAKTGTLRGDMHLTRLLLLGALNWTTVWYRPGGARSPDDIAAQLCAMVLGESVTATAVRPSLLS